MRMVLGLLFLAAIVVGAFILMFGLIALIRRDRERMHGSGQLGSAMQQLESLFVESKKHVIEAEQREEKEEESSGDPPVK